MNYKSKMNAWAIEKAMFLMEHNAVERDIESVKTAATELLDYAYVPDEDMVDVAQRLYELVKNAPPGRSMIPQIKFSMECIERERVENGIDEAQVDEDTVKN